MQALLASEVSLPVHVHGARIIAKSKYVIHHGMCTAGHIDIQYVCIIHSCMYIMPFVRLSRLTSLDYVMVIHNYV